MPASWPSFNSRAQVAERIFSLITWCAHRNCYNLYTIWVSNLTPSSWCKVNHLHYHRACNLVVLQNVPNNASSIESILQRPYTYSLCKSPTRNRTPCDTFIRKRKNSYRQEFCTERQVIDSLMTFWTGLINACRLMFHFKPNLVIMNKVNFLINHYIR